jgi:hypothetical protein
MSVIGLDLDGTLARFVKWDSGEAIGEPDLRAVRLLKMLFRARHTTCVWTTRPEYVVRKWLTDNNLISFVNHINESPYPTESGKASFYYYIGDDAIRWEGNSDSIFKFISNNTNTLPIIRETGFSSHSPKLFYQGVGRMQVDMFEEHWKKAWEDHSSRKIAFLTICSHAKPYSKSFIHTTIRKKLYELGVLNELDYIHISNAGIIPALAEMTYPFNAYDWDGTLCDPQVREYHIAALKRRYREWRDTYGKRYEKIVIYLREGGNTFSAIRGFVYPPAVLVGADPADEHYPKYVELSDIDDCLTSEANLSLLNLVLRTTL